MPDNLPLQLTSFVGRERDIARVRQLLDGSRLVTLTGPGGVGKTRLALATAASLRDAYPDGVWLVELAGLADAALLPGTVASTLDVREEQGRAMPDVLAAELGKRTLLLVLDNCEHLLAGCAALADGLLRHCPKLRLLATSRETLAVPGEIAWLVPSLPAETDAAQLFLERAAAALPSAEPARWNPGTVRDICRRLDGIPLAIELAATRVRALSVEQIAARLDHRFELLATGPRTVVPRHQTLRALVDWSYELLPDEERLLFRRLSVFAGGWTVEAAEGICSGDGIHRARVLSLLMQLVEKSLVVTQTDGSHYRYRLLETLRQYAAEELNSSSEAETIRARHLEYFVRRAEPGYGDSPREALLTLLNADLDNVRAALGWSLEGGSPLLGLRLAAAVGTHWNVGGHPTEGLRWLTTLLERVDAKSANVLAQTARARGLAATGYLACGLGHLPAATEALDEGLRLWRQLGNGRHTSFCLRWLGRLAILRQQPDAARAYLEEALALARSIGHPAATYEALHALGIALHEDGEGQPAAAAFKEALELAGERGDSVYIHLCTLNLGVLAFERGELASAGDWLSQSLQAAPTNEGWVSRTLEAIAALAAARAQPERAVRLDGAAAALQHNPGVTVPPRLQVLLRRRIDAARQALGQNRAATARAEGAAMDLQRAIEYALDESAAASQRPRAGELTARECEVAALLARGLTNPQIAEQLVVSRGTVKRHIENVLTKLGLDSRAQVAAWAAQQGLLDTAAAG